MAGRATSRSGGVSAGEGRRRRRRAALVGGAAGGFASVMAMSLLLAVVVVAALALIPPVASASAASPPQRQNRQPRELRHHGAGVEGDYDDSYDDVAAPDLQQQQQQQNVEEEEEEDEYEDPPPGPEDEDDRASGGGAARAGAAAGRRGEAPEPGDDADEAGAGIVDMTTPDYLAEHEGAVMDAEAEAEYERELREAGLESADVQEEEQLPAEKKLTELEDKLYFGNLTARNVSEAFRGLFEFVAGAPTLEEAKEMNRVLAGGASEVRLLEAKKKLARAQADIMRAFGGGGGSDDDDGDVMAGEEAITLEDIPGEEGKLNIKFDFKLAQGNGAGAAKAQAIFRALGAAPPPAAGGADEPEPDEETQEAVEAVRAAIKNALQAKQSMGAALQEASADQADSADDTPAAPEDWLAVSDALYLLAALVEAGVVPPDAYPQPPRPESEEDEATRTRRQESSLPAFTSTFTAADYSAGWGWSARLVSSGHDGGARIHPAAADPKGWAREALLVSAEMGSTEARLAVGDRILHGRGAYPEVAEGPNCEAALDWIRPVADQAAKDAESSGDFQLPRQPGRLRERERDARWVSEEELENGDEQITMEEDMAARGVPEAQRHIGYRRLVGRGVDRDEAGALREFQAAAANGDELAAFNLGYMHMKGLSVPQNFTEARRRFDAAIAKGLPAAYNGIGVLHFNGWGTDRNYTAARLSFEEGAERGDPDSHFNLGALYSSGLGVPRDQEKAVKCYEAASQAGHWRAPHVLAIAHQTGNGTPRNCTRAAQLLQVFIEERLAWARDQEEAMDVLDGGPVADTTHDGTHAGTHAGTTRRAPPDPWSALVRYTLLAEKGSESATANAAWMLSKGLGYEGDDNLELAERMHERSVILGNREAHVDLGDIKWAKLKTNGGPKLSPPASDASTAAAVDATGEDDSGGGGRGDGEGTDGEGATTTEVTNPAGRQADDETANGADPEPPRPLQPPPGATPEEEIAFHYGEAAHAGYAEGTVNLAWAYAHGVGVARNLSHASELLYHAYVNSATEVEAFAPLLALVGVKCWALVESAADAMGLGLRLGRVLSGLISYHRNEGDAWTTSRGGGGGGGGKGLTQDAAADPRVASAGGHQTENMAAAAAGAGGGGGGGTGSGGGGGAIAAESGRMATAAWVPHAYSTLENVLLGVLLFLAALVGYTRFVVMGRTGGAAEVPEGEREVPLAAVAGAGAAAAVTIGVSIAVFAGRAAAA